MIQFNLLPDIKLEYIKSRRTKRSVMLIAGSVAAVALVIFILLFVSVGLQKQHLNNLSNDIKRDSKQLEGIEDIDRILTVQNQLNKLTELHEAKPVASRLKEYITLITPAQVSYADIEIDFVSSTMTFSGSADTIKTVNQFVDTLKFTKYRQIIDDKESSEETNAFTEVVLTSFGKDEKGTSYDISFKFDPIIFSSQTKVKLVVPNIITTRSAIERPSENLLQPLSNPSGGEQ